MAGQKYNAIVSNDTLTNGSSIYLQMNTPQVGTMKLNGITASATDVCLMSLIEAPTITDGTTVVERLNRNRANSTFKPGTLVLFSDPTSISLGKVIERQILGAGGGQGVTIALEGDPIILAQNVKYLIKVTNNSGTTVQAQIRISWEEGI